MNQEFHPNPNEIDALIVLAEENLNLAKLELDHGFIRGAISKAYYVFLHLARAALLSEGIITKTHGGTVARFGEIFVKSNRVAKDLGRWFNRALRARQEADYEALKSFTADEARETIEQAEEFYIEVKKIIARDSG